jgi:HSP20 family protein
MSLIRTNRGLRSRNLIPRTLFQNDFFDLDFPFFDAGMGDEFSSSFIPAANVREDEKEFTVELSVPGYQKKDIHVEVDSNNVLHINGKHEDEYNEENENYTRREFSRGSFSRSFQLPESIKEEKISAKCKDGVLRVELPKKESAIINKKVKEIAIA